MSRPYFSRSSGFSGPFVRVNGKIRAREVRVIGSDGKQLGVLSLGEAINAARAEGVDLVEIAPNATPPVCRLVDYGKFRYEQSKKDKESRKHHHANKVKEIQLSPSIDPHDLSVKLTHAIDFLCEEMKVKVTLRFRGREMAHQEFGFQVVKDFMEKIAPYGHPDSEPKLIGRGINVMVSPLPRNKRARNPNESANPVQDDDSQDANVSSDHNEAPTRSANNKPSNSAPSSSSFANSPFAELDIPAGDKGN